MKTLPTKARPTSLSELDIRNGIGVLVSDWAVQLEHALQMAAFKWERDDYPHVNTFIQKLPGVFFPQPLLVPSQPQAPAPQRKVLFPPCRP